jgi:hypothetical protein
MLWYFKREKDMNQKMIENLPLLSFKKTKYAVLFSTKSGNFWIKGDSFQGKIYDEAVFTVNEFLRLREKLLGNANKMKIFEKILMVKKELGARVIDGD